jgi:site-specific recombinase XerD
MNGIKKVRGVPEKVPGSGVWWIQQFDADGRRRREKVGTKSNAIKLYQKRKNESLQGKKLPETLRKRDVTLGEIASATLEYSLAKKASYRQDKVRMVPIVHQFGNRTAESILPEEFESWLNDEAEQREWTQATRNRYIALLKLTYRLAEKNHKIENNPARLLRMSKPDNGRIRFLNQFLPAKTDVEYLRVHTGEEARLRAVILKSYPEHMPEFEIALHTGMRPSEQYSMLWDQVDFSLKLVTIPRSKNGEMRHIPLNSVALAAFKALQQRSLDGRQVFVNRHGKPLRGYKHWFDPTVCEAGIRNFTWYCIRHTFASRLVMAGVHLRAVADLMGHKTIQMTMRYAHLAPAHQLDAVERLTTGFPQNDANFSAIEPSATSSATDAESATVVNPATVN